LFGSLEFFASFLDQAKNEEPSRLEAKRSSAKLKVSPIFKFHQIL